MEFVKGGYIQEYGLRRQVEEVLDLVPASRRSVVMGLLDRMVGNVSATAKYRGRCEVYEAAGVLSMDDIRALRREAMGKTEEVTLVQDTGAVCLGEINEAGDVVSRSGVWSPLRGKRREELLKAGVVEVVKDGGAMYRDRVNQIIETKNTGS